MVDGYGYLRSVRIYLSNVRGERITDLPCIVRSRGIQVWKMWVKCGSVRIMEWVSWTLIISRHIWKSFIYQSKGFLLLEWTAENTNLCKYDPVCTIFISIPLLNPCLHISIFFCISLLWLNQILCLPLIPPCWSVISLYTLSSHARVCRARVPFCHQLAFSWIGNGW